MANFNGTLRLEIQTARSNVFIWGLATWGGYRFAGPADTATGGTEWTNVLGKTHEIKLRRGGKPKGFTTEIEAGDLQATVLDPAFDPSSSPYIKPGTPIRLIHDTKAVFTGQLRQVKVTYKAGQPRVFISAVDKVKDLANIRRVGGYFELLHNRIPTLLAKHGIPFAVHGTGTKMLQHNQFDSNLLEHIVLAVNTDMGRWFVDKDNVVQVYTKGQALPAPVYTFTDKQSTGNTELEYVDIGVSYDSSRLFNELIVENVLRDFDDNSQPISVHTKFGPYRNVTSMATYGTFSETVLTNQHENGIPAWAAEVLDRGGNPELHVSDVRVNLSDKTDIAANFEIYDVVSVEYENEYVHLDDNFAVIAVEHEISASNTDHKWMTTLELNKLGGN